MEGKLDYILDLLRSHIDSYNSVEIGDYFDLVVLDDLTEISALKRKSIVFVNDSSKFTSERERVTIGEVDLLFFRKLNNTDNLFTRKSVIGNMYVYVIGDHFVFPYDFLSVMRRALFPDNDCKQDQHLRYLTLDDYIHEKQLLDYPQLNQAAFLLASLIQMDFGVSCQSKFNVLMTHDVDSLSGFDLYKIGKRLLSVCRFHELRKNIGLLVKNIFFQNTYHLDNVKKILSMERDRGIQSLWFILNGQKGRYKARTSSKKLSEILSVVDKSQIGLHYNYDTFESPKHMESQIIDFDHHFGFTPSFGRAHYLRMSTKRSYENVSKYISHDHSLGYYDELGFRSSIAGTYKGYGVGLRSFELTPLYAMDAMILNNLDRLDATYQRLAKIGGTLSLLVHHDYIYNPEFESGYFLYEEILRIHDQHCPYHAH